METIIRDYIGATNDYSRDPFPHSLSFSFPTKHQGECCNTARSMFKGSKLHCELGPQ